MDPEILATCSIDTFVYLWDMRVPRRPVGKWAEWRAGATQVKWNHSNPHQVALSHHHAFYLWDTRHGAQPLLKIDNAHAGKINGLDFSGSNDRLITCSNDKSVKFWDLSGASENAEPTIVINTDYPVARARPLPFGKDSCVGIMPVRGGNNAVDIINYKAAYEAACDAGETGYLSATPDFSFKGHQGPVKDFLWRTQHSNYDGWESKNAWPEYQLVTWSSLDFDLKLWPHEKDLYNIANYNPLHQKLLDLLVSDEEVDYQRASSSPTKVGTPDSEISEESQFIQAQPVKYESYAKEPVLNWGDLAKDASGDLLSKLTLFKIKRSQEYQGGSTQLNHLNWISGVRMGRTTVRKESSANNEVEEEDGPSNLGEEVSIVGHKFPKVRFEKISVSTGHLVLSLRGPLPIGVAEAAPQQASNGKTEKDKKDTATKSANTSTAAVTTDSANPTSSAVNSAAVNGTSSSAHPTQNFQIIQNTNSSSLAGAAAVSAGARTSTGGSNVSPGMKQAEFFNSNLASTIQESSSEQKLVFIRLEVKFPKMYPYLENIDARNRSKNTKRKRKFNQIRFEIEETHEITPNIKREMISTLDSIGLFYSNKYNKFCLEPCLRYLMGDKIELDDSLMLERTHINDDTILEGLEDVEIGNEGWVDDLIDDHEAAALLAKSISAVANDDDDDDDDAELIPGITDQFLSINEPEKAPLEHDVQTQGQLVNESNLRHDSTPLPKGCGAYWSRTGQLVCFFIPKSDSEHEARNRSHYLKFTKNEFGLKSEYLEINNESDVESIASSDGHLSDDNISRSSTSSSDDSFSDDWDEMLQDDIPSRSRIPGIFRGTAAMGRRLINGENADVSVNGNASGKGSGSNYKTSTRDGSVLRITTRRTRNASNCRNFVTIMDFSHLLPDKYELARGYRLLGDRPEVLAHHNGQVALRHGYVEISEAWRLIEMVLMKDTSSNELFGGRNEMADPSKSTSGRFYWGNHPYGHSWFVRELFNYFEQRGNLQMLVMLSCILYENPAIAESRGSNVPIHTPYAALPPHPSLIALKHRGLQQLRSSEEMNNISEPHSLEGVMADIGTLSRRTSIRSTRDFQLSRSIPNSLEIHQRGLSPLRLGSYKKIPPAIGLIAPLDDPFGSFDSAIDRGFRSVDGGKRFSRVSIAGGRNSKRINPKKNGQQMVLHSRRGGTKPPPSVSVQMLNVDKLDFFDNVYGSPLLGSIDQAKIISYREQYADALYTWGLPIHRVKILKFNYPDDATSLELGSRYEVHSAAFGYRYRKALNPNQLLLNPITPIATAKDNAWNTRKRNKLQYCGLCALPVTKRVVICTKCEHILHSHCAAAWWSIDEDEPEDETTTDCPTGCGCSCLDQTL